ncbi:hypothetical protein ACPWD0_000255 [Escherichia coli]
MQEMTLAEASLQAQQVEVISRMIERNHEEITGKNPVNICLSKSSSAC